MGGVNIAFFAFTPVKIYLRRNTITDIPAIAEIARRKGALMMADCYQALGTMQFDVKKAGVLENSPTLIDACNTLIALSVLYSESDRIDEAKAEAAELLKILPRFSVDVWGERNPMKDREQVERDMTMLRKAGSPD